MDYKEPMSDDQGCASRNHDSDDRSSIGFNSHLISLREDLDRFVSQLDNMQQFKPYQKEERMHFCDLDEFARMCEQK